MPNWCNNTIIVTGKAIDIKSFDDQFKKVHNVYSGGTSSYKEGDKIEYHKDYIEHKIIGPQIHFLTQVSKSEGYSFTNIIEQTKEDFLNGWYDWSIDNWGTKWDAYDIESSGIDLVDDAIKDGELDAEIEVIYSFNTVWIPSFKVTLGMSQQHHDLQFIHEYEEEGMQFAGKITYSKGEVISSFRSI